MPIVNIPNVGNVDFPDGMSEADIGKAIASMNLDKAGYSPAQEMLTGATLGFFPKIYSGMTGTPLPAIRQAQEAYRSENPVESTLLNVAGSIPTGGLFGKATLGALNAAQKAIGSALPSLGAVGATVAESTPSLVKIPVQAGIVGASEGAVRGIGEDTGAMSGAIMGGIGGGIGGLGSNVLSATGRNVSQRVRGGDKFDPLLVRVGERARLAGLNEGSVIPEGEALAEQGGRIVSGRLEGPLQRLSGAVYRRSDAASASVPQVLDDRSKALRSDLPEQISSALGAQPNIEDVIAARRAAARPLYEEAFSQPMVSQPADMANIMNQPASLAAYNQAAQNFGARGKQAPTLESVIFGNAPVDFMDEVKRQLQKVYGRAGTPNAPSGVVADREALETLANRYTSSLKASAPEAYTKALEKSGDAIRMEKAFEEGRKMYGKKSKDVIAKIKDMTPDEQEGFKAGLAAAAKELAGAQRDTATQTVVSNLIGSPQTRESLIAAGANRQAIEAANQRAARQVAFQNTLGGGSPTAPNAVNDAAMQSDLQRTINFTKNIPGAIVDMITQGTTGQRADKLSEILFNFADQAKNQEMLKKALEAERRYAAMQGNVAAYGGAAGSSATSGLLGSK